MVPRWCSLPRLRSGARGADDTRAPTHRMPGQERRSGTPPSSGTSPPDARSRLTASPTAMSMAKATAANSVVPRGLRMAGSNDRRQCCRAPHRRSRTPARGGLVAATIEPAANHRPCARRRGRATPARIRPVVPASEERGDGGMAPPLRRRHRVIPRVLLRSHRRRHVRLAGATSALSPSRLGHVHGRGVLSRAVAGLEEVLAERRPPCDPY
jgi:hypothetical protein